MLWYSSPKDWRRDWISVEAKCFSEMSCWKQENSVNNNNKQSRLNKECHSFIMSLPLLFAVFFENFLHEFPFLSTRNDPLELLV